MYQMIIYGNIVLLIYYHFSKCKKANIPSPSTINGFASFSYNICNMHRIRGLLHFVVFDVGVGFDDSLKKDIYKNQSI